MSDPATDKAPEIPDQSAPPARRAGTAGETAGTAGGPAVPEYKGAPLDADRGPGLGCFWTQVVLLVVLLVATPLSVVFAAPPWFSAALLIILLVLLFFVGQTMIFLLRLVAADRRSRRRPMGANARQTVGQMEDAAVSPARDESATAPAPPPAASARPTPAPSVAAAAAEDPLLPPRPTPGSDEDDATSS